MDARKQVMDTLMLEFNGKMDNNYWSAIFTQRGENIRIISVRKARKEEMEIYEN